MSLIRPLWSRSRTWLAVCAATVACNSIFDIQDPIEQPHADGACILNSNCPSGQVCLFRLCSPPCETDVDCPGAASRCLRTNDGTACVSETQASCGGDGATECPGGTVCSEQACYAQCTGASVCADGHACANGICKGDAPNNSGGTSSGGTTGSPQGGQAGGAEAGAAAGEAGSAGAGGEGGAGPNSTCIANARSCEDNAVVTCNADGSGYLPSTNCGAKQTCVAGACADQECTPSVNFCSGNSVRACADNGLSSQEVKACGAGQYCDATSAACKQGVCAPDQPACDVNRATTCNSSGSGFLAGGTTCKAAETCESGMCLSHVCTPNEVYCQGQDVKKCAANGLSSSVTTTCLASKTCVESGSTASCTGVCGPGQKNCSGNGVAPCDSVGQWGPAVACKKTQTCSAGACAACPSSTVNCDDNSLNGCETHLDAATTCGTTCDDLVACSTQHGSASCTNATCGTSSCSSTYADCGGVNDGCETNLATDSDNCDGCGKACSSSHMASRTCSGRSCVGTCAGGYGDCDSNKQTNGCETHIDVDATHCGDCATACKYRSCQAGSCQASTWGNNQITAGPTTTKLAKDKLWTLKINVVPAGVSSTLLQALGIVVVVNGTNPAANIRLGLYTESGGNAPNTLEAQTAPFVTSDGISEQLLASPVSISTGAHWVAFLADQDVRVHVDAATTTWISAPITYASVNTLPAAFPFPTALTVERGHLFAVTTP